MGIPKFYRWLSERYPLINEKIDGPICPEFDALYLDMNAIFHRCSHGSEVDSATITNAEMFCSILKYISYLVELAKPKELLYLAVDGVAPRAKQNQQRQRRFVSAQEREYNNDNSFDSNAITPGTSWMESLSSEMEVFIAKQISSNDLWNCLTVLYSDHLVPGEGEHKIMQYIRHSKMQSNYNPNTRHCIYGLDADLIMLSLVSHERHFALLREEIVFGINEKRKRKRKNAFQLLHISVLRNYLYLEFCEMAHLLSFTFEFERIIDDFVFISMFVGNDFIPHLPTVNIATKGIQYLFKIYKLVLPTLNGYIIENGLINIYRFKLLCKHLSENQTESFIKQYQYLKKAKKYYLNKTQRFRQLNTQQIDEKITELKNGSFEYYRDRNMNNNNNTICLDYIRGLQWVIHYYYQDLKDWSYYYPHHYAPLISDMQYIDDNTINTFNTQSVPYKPFQQLLAVLPIKSNHLLPKEYRDLMHNESIHKYYPKQFEVDMNLSTAPWEGIALLPFIDEKELKDAINTLPNHSFKLNEHREPIVFTFDINQVISSKYTLPSLDHCGGRFIPNICCGSTMIIRGSPHLAAIPFKTIIKKVPVKPFGINSKYDTLLLKVIDTDNNKEMDAQYLNKVLTHPLYVSWPYFREAQISEIITQNCTHSIVYLNDDKTETVSNKHTKTQQNVFNKTIHNVHQSFLLMYGVDVGDIRVLIKCRMLYGMRRKGNKIVKKWKDKEEIFPIQITISGTMKTHHDITPFQAKYKELIVDDRYLTRPIDLEQKLNIGQPVIYIGSQKNYYGLYGRITSEPNNGYIDIRVFARFKPTEFPLKDLQRNKAMRYYKLEELMSMLAIQYNVLSRICAQVNIVHKPNNFDIGLNLKLSKQRLLVPEYCKVEIFKKKPGKGRNKMEHKERIIIKISEKGVALIREYMTKFPHVFKVLQRCKDYSERFHADDFCPLENLRVEESKEDDDGTEANVDNDISTENNEMLIRKKKVAEGAKFLQKVAKWIKEQEVSTLPLIDFSAKVLPREVIKEIEEEADRYYNAQIRMPPKVYHLKRVPIGEIYTANPDIPWSPTDKDTFNLGNRVSVLRSDEGIPFGTQGTVVGIHDKFIEVFIDCNVMKGGTLHNRCSDHRGVILPYTSVLNLTANIDGKTQKLASKKYKKEKHNDNQHQRKSNKNRNCENKKKEANVDNSMLTLVNNGQNTNDTQEIPSMQIPNIESFDDINLNMSNS